MTFALLTCSACSGHFERFKHEELIAVANAHGVTFVNDLPLEKIRAAVSDHVFSLRCVSNMKRLLLQIAPGCFGGLG